MSFYAPSYCSLVNIKWILRHTVIAPLTQDQTKTLNLMGGGPRVLVSTAAFHARVRGSVPGVWRTVSSQSSHHPQEVLLAQFSLYVHKGGLKPDSFHFIFT